MFLAVRFRRLLAWFGVPIIARVLMSSLALSIFVMVVWLHRRLSFSLYVLWLILRLIMPARGLLTLLGFFHYNLGVSEFQFS